VLVNPRRPLPEMGRCVWRVLIGNRPQRVNTAIPRPIVDTQLIMFATPCRSPCFCRLMTRPTLGESLLSAHVALVIPLHSCRLAVLPSEWLGSGLSVSFFLAHR
jgi:hypothetical protein